mmetsp:Transcript_14718/g.33016  ORF Transcript_14718/g.33016 Transcript_14718/m.33016 type:complete len:438 (-) Transcript_14718:517-1830(-)
MSSFEIASASFACLMCSRRSLCSCLRRTTSFRISSLPWSRSVAHFARTARCALACCFRSSATPCLKCSPRVRDCCSCSSSACRGPRAASIRLLISDSSSSRSTSACRISDSAVRCASSASCTAACNSLILFSICRRFSLCSASSDFFTLPGTPVGIQYWFPILAKESTLRCLTPSSSHSSRVNAVFCLSAARSFSFETSFPFDGRVVPASFHRSPRASSPTAATCAVASCSARSFSSWLSAAVAAIECRFHLAWCAFAMVSRLFSNLLISSSRVLRISYSRPLAVCPFRSDTRPKPGRDPGRADTRVHPAPRSLGDPPNSSRSEAHRAETRAVLSVSVDLRLGGDIEERRSVLMLVRRLPSGVVTREPPYWLLRDISNTSAASAGSSSFTSSASSAASSTVAGGSSTGAGGGYSDRSFRDTSAQTPILPTQTRNPFG